MFTMGTQFDITEEGLEGLEDLRQSDLVDLPFKTKLEYLILTTLDLEGMMDYQGLLEETPRKASQSDVSDILKSLSRKGWVTTTWSDSSFREPTGRELDQVEGRERR